MAAPLSKTDEIVILSGEGSRVTGEVNRLLAELPVSVNALTGVDLTKVRMALFSTRVNRSHQTPHLSLILILTVVFRASCLLSGLEDLGV